MSKLDKRAISTTLVIAIFLLSIFSVAIPVSAQVTTVVVTEAPDPILTGETTTITVTVTAGAGEAWTGTITVTDPLLVDSTATITGSGPAADTAVYPTDFSGPPTTAIAGSYTIIASAAVGAQTPVEGAGSFVVQESGTLSIDTTPVTGDVIVGGISWGAAPQSQIVAVGTYTVTFGAIADYVTPDSQDAVVTADTTTNIIGVYGTSDFTIDHVSSDVVQYDDTVTVWGSGVTSGSVIEIYWDTAVGTGAYLLNSTEGDPDGTFDCDFDVPSDIVGNHYIWVKDVATLTTKSYGPITMDPKITLSPSSGLEDDDVTMKGYGFAAEVEIVAITFEPVHYTGGFTTSPAEPDTDELGYWTATFEVPAPLTGVEYDVTGIDEDGNSAFAIFTFGASISFDVDEGPVGSVVEISGRGFKKSPTPDVIVQGNVYILDGTTRINCWILDLTTTYPTVEADSNGEFDLEVFIPQVSDVGDYDIVVETTSTDDIDAEFTVTGLAEIETEYAFGVQGTTIGIEGWNFTRKSGEEVQLELWEDPDDDGDYTFAVDREDFEVDSKGYFSGTFQVPARSSDKYLLKATQHLTTENYKIEAETGFRIGLMLVLIYPTSGPTGTEVVLTGMGFTEGGDWNATFGGVSIIEDAEIDDETNLEGELGGIPTFIVPTLDVGQYTIEVNDISDPDSIITVSLEFMVTETTTLVTDPLVAPNEYLVEVKGEYFSEAFADVDFIIYNVTADGEVDKDWDMDIVSEPFPVETDKDGNFTALWKVPESDVMSIGDYLINATDDDGLFAQYLFSIVEKTVEISPRKPSFAMGETVYFDIESSFAMDGSYIEIYDPYDHLYWRTDLFEADEWLKVGTIERMPYYQQTAGGNPMALMDATVGPWFWEMFYEDDPVCNGTFEVTPAPSDILTDRINALSGELTQLADDITGVTDEIAGDIADLSSDISDVEANVQDMVDDITADLAEELAGVAAATEDAVSDLETSIGDIAAAQSELADEVGDMGQDTAAAEQAANDARDSVQGLTTIVYGAIACSLIAALAAIVSLMQISKKIA